jgi:hypothetical protein
MRPNASCFLKQETANTKRKKGWAFDHQQEKKMSQDSESCSRKNLL